MSEKKRMKASDVFAQANYFLGKTSSFHEAFPDIKDIRVEVLEDGEGVRYDQDINRRLSVYTLSNLPGEYINCRNPRCYNGGFHLRQLIRYMSAKRETQYEGTEMCQGYEGSPKGWINRGPCENRFRVKIQVKYADQP